MNERIQKLAEQAGYTKDMFGVGHWDMPECKKFAELIVQECCDILDPGEHELIGRFQARKILQKHFGVEE